MSLIAGKEIVDCGSISRIGDGSKVNIWKDKWVNKRPSYMVTPPQATPTHLTVDKIIDEGSRGWNFNLLAAFFMTEDRTIIEQIYLSKVDFEDKLIWLENELGQLTIKSAYVVALRCENEVVADRSSRHTLWFYIWSTSVLPKVKVFWWRLVRGIIPVTDQLRVRGIFYRTVARFVGYTNRIALGTRILHMKFDASFPSGLSSLERQLQQTWDPPLADWFKLNVDVSYRSCLKDATCGIMLRDSSSLVIFSVAVGFGNIRSPLQAELMEILVGLQAINSIQFPCLLMESDFIHAIREITKHEGSMFEWFGFVLDIVSISHLFAAIEFSHMRKSANELAHNVAKSHLPCWW
ncbi:hypothetical protein PTKIN_Ptkin15bG0084800 [Pterospermum kingtungense]